MEMMIKKMMEILMREEDEKAIKFDDECDSSGDHDAEKIMENIMEEMNMEIKVIRAMKIMEKVKKIDRDGESDEVKMKKNVKKRTYVMKKMMEKVIVKFTEKEMKFENE